MTDLAGHGARSARVRFGAPFVPASRIETGIRDRPKRRPGN